MADPLVLYGATGFTGQLILARMRAAGLAPVLAGRNPERLASLAREGPLSWRAASVTRPDELDAAFRDMRVVVNAAGPFADTALPVAHAALRQRAHYLDVCGEVDVIEQLATRHACWRRGGIMVMPGTGFDVVPSDCLAVRVARESVRPVRLRIGIAGLYLMSRGSAETLAREWGRGTRLRRDGHIATVAPGALEHPFDFGQGPASGVLVSWGDVASAYYSTGIENIETYFEATPALRAVLAANRIAGSMLGTPLAQRLVSTWHDYIPAGPPPAARARITTVIVAEVEQADGSRRALRTRAGDSYEFTADAATAITRRVLGGDATAGFQTPARHFGPDLLAELSANPVERIAA